MSQITIYLAHAKQYPNFEQNLYLPLVDSLSKKFQLILPHQDSDSPFDSRQIIFEKQIDLALAELSYPATGLGVEMGWVNSQSIPIIGLAKKDFKVSSSAKMIFDEFLIYERLDLGFLKILLDSIEVIITKN